MKRILTLLISALCIVNAAFAQEEGKNKTVINDYSMIGVHYGANLSTMIASPARSFTMQLRPVDFGITYTKYCKMFGYMPYFGLQTGIFYSEQSYKFSRDSDGVPSYAYLGADEAVYKGIELPMQAQMHIDFWRMKLLVNLGPYIGYRYSVKRDYSGYFCGPDDVRRQWAETFHPNEYRFYYGIQGGVGIGFMLDPIEIHFTATYKYGLSYLRKPNTSSTSFEENEDRSQYYYTFVNPSNIIVGVSLHYQLSRRIGRSHKELREIAKQEAMEIMGTNTKTATQE